MKRSPGADSVRRESSLVSLPRSPVRQRSSYLSASQFEQFAQSAAKRFHDDWVES